MCFSSPRTGLPIPSTTKIKSLIHSRRIIVSDTRKIIDVVAVATAIETNTHIRKIAVIETGSNWRR